MIGPKFSSSSLKILSQASMAVSLGAVLNIFLTSLPTPFPLAYPMVDLELTRERTLFSGRDENCGGLELREEPSGLLMIDVDIDLVCLVTFAGTCDLELEAEEAGR